MFVRFRGVKEEKILVVVEGLMVVLLFEEYVDKMVKVYR